VAAVAATAVAVVAAAAAIGAAGVAASWHASLAEAHIVNDAVIPAPHHLLL